MAASHRGQSPTGGAASGPDWAHDRPNTSFTNPDPEGVQPNGLARSGSPVRRYATGLALIAGILVGWLVIGWGLWPVGWVECSPPDLQAAYQQRYVALVAAEYARTGNAAQAQADLASWDPDALAELLSAMENQAPSLEARRPLAKLREALSLTRVQPSLWALILSQKSIAGPIILAALFLLAALALACWPLVAGLRRRAQAQSASPAPGEKEGALASWLDAVQALEEEDNDAGAGAQAGPQARAEGQGEQNQGSGSQPEQQAGERKVERIRLDESQAEGGAAAGDTKPKEGQVGKPQEGASTEGENEGEAKCAGAAELILKEEEETGELLAGDDLLSSLLDGMLLADPRREALAGFAEPVHIVSLAQQAGATAVLLSQLPRSKKAG